MRIRFQADNDLNRAIVAGVLRREPAIGFRTAQAAGLHGLDDRTVLERAARDGRILVTHDKQTMSTHLARFLGEGNASPGVLVVIPQDAAIGLVIETLVLIWAASEAEEWINRAAKIPF